MRVDLALRQAVPLLKAAEIIAPQLTAEVLLLRAIHADRAFLRAHPERELTAVEQIHFARHLHERLAGTPTQYITGHQEFWGLDLLVNPSVLIPRPETEHVVERTLQLAANASTIADCGTGSGCIALALAKELPAARIVATDISLAALLTAQANAIRLELPIALVGADLLSAFPDAAFDLVVSNPPYISLLEAPTLAREVRDHEPAVALFAGSDGADLYRRLIPEAARTLRPGGWVVVELGFHAAALARTLLSGPAWHPPATDCDLAGIERVIYARRTSK